ncbi:HPP family protein [Chitinophaga tropicalis]|uniref:HPP family protein n=1 Tax=Chitinophaga tropicalis TaxID=2683588 RepID=A0A7K1U542_9BACT|nr:HPP family protein [Chitinophaga tropicalis]MVT09478.1 HPP family protein [Chitinophaga tropicalis]
MRQKLRRHARTARYILYKETLVDYREHLWTFLGSFTGIGLIGLLHSQYLVATDNLFLIGSFGASSVLIYGVINSPLAQPRNLLGGHLISAIIGVTVHKIVPDEIWLAAALAVSLSIVCMQITKTLHPPGGATALIANIGSERILSMGYWYVLSPVLTGCIILLIVAIFFNNRTSYRSYPKNKKWYLLKRGRRAKKRHSLLNA